MARPGRKQLNVFVSEASFDAWRKFADDNGVSVTALIDAIGRNLQQRPQMSLRTVVAEARRFDTANRRGRRG